MADRLDTLIDHAAALQREVNRLSQEVLMLALAGLGLALILTIVTWNQWQAE